MELEDLKRSWEENDRRLDASIRLNTRLLHESVLDKAETALRRLSRLLALELLLNLGITIALGSFLAEHAAQGRFLLPAAALDLCAIALIVTGIRQLATIAKVDYSAPVVSIQKRLESLRVERLRAAKWTLLLAPLLWTPLLVVSLKGVLGVDAYAVFGAGWLAANLLFGLLVIALAVGISRRYAGRMNRSPVVRRLMRDLAGHNLAAATGFLSSLASFESEEGRA